MKKVDHRKYAIYSRKSKFTGKGESIENQIDLCRSQININYGTVNEEDILVYEDEGFSGGNTNRPQLQKMIDDIRAKKIKSVICYRLDRISRNVGDFVNLKNELERYQVHFISVSDKFDTSTPTGNAMMMMVSVFSQMEREVIAERIRDNMRQLAKSGRWLGGKTPTGYKSKECVGSVTVDGKIRKAFRLESIPEESELVKLIYQTFLTNNSLTQTETVLLQQHINTKNDKPFTRFSIRAILQNPVYMIADKDAWDYFTNHNVEVYAEETDFNGKHAIMAYNKTIQKPGQTNKLRKIEEWIIAIGKHKGLISGADWVKVQKILEQNKSKSYHKPKSNVALLSGLLFCDNCGSFLRPKLSKRKNSEGDFIYSYLCETKEKSRMHNCQMKNPNGNELDKAVCEHIKALSEDSSHFFKQLEQAKKKLMGSHEEYDKKIENLQKTLQKKKKEIDNLVAGLAQSTDTPAHEYITQQINALHEETESLKKQIEDFEHLTKDHVLSDQEFDIIKEMLSNFGSAFDTMSVEQKRSALRSLIRRIVWDGENVHIYLFGSEDDVEFPEEQSRENMEPKRAYSK